MKVNLILLPIARWNDWSGLTNPHRNTYETISLMSSLAAITKKVNIFSTIHLPFVNPIFAARASVTLNHISNGRIGLNLVCGWNKTEFEMFNVKRKNFFCKSIQIWRRVAKCI